MYPDYYVLIKRPMDLSTIRNKLKDRSYTSLEEFKSDFKLVFSNAKEYNITESQIYEDTVTLEQIFDDLEKKHFVAEVIPKYKEGTRVFVEWGDSIWYESMIEKIRKRVEAHFIYRVKYHDGSYANVSEEHMKVGTTFEWRCIRFDSSHRNFNSHIHVCFQNETEILGEISTGKGQNNGNNISEVYKRLVLAIDKRSAHFFPPSRIE